jgi:organic radical activating enzyme
MPVPANDTSSFRPEVLNTWKPEGAPGANLVRWIISEWCNYRCPYCPQTHGRHEPKGDGLTAHAFDNFPLERWLAAFRRHFAERRLSMVITGGEPLLDRKNMSALLTALHEMNQVECIRVDTNASWQPDWYRTVPKSKIILMCTFHPSQVEESRFFARVRSLRDEGFKIGMINYVMSRQQKGNYFEHKAKFLELGIPLHPNPLWNNQGLYSNEDMKLFAEELPALDYQYRTGQSPKGRKCLFPEIAYEMDYRGNIYAGCHPEISGSFFDGQLPKIFAGPVHCPHSKCVCLDKYSFLEGCERNVTMNPLECYSNALLT